MTETQVEVTPEEIINGEGPEVGHRAIKDVPGPAYCGLWLDTYFGMSDEWTGPVCERCDINFHAVRKESNT